MRSIITKAVTGTMIAAAALAISACSKTETNTTNTDLSVTTNDAPADNMTPMDGGAMNGTDTVTTNETTTTTNTTTN